jgi:hypothetical protein
MPDNSLLTPPYLDPSDANMQAYMDANRKQMLAQMLMQNMQQSTQTPSDWNSMKVVPRRGLLQNLAPLASALMARKAMDNSQSAQSQYFKKMYGGDQQQPTGPGAGIIDPGAPPEQQQAAQAVTDMPAARPGLLPPAQNPLLPAGASRGTAQAALGMLGPQEYAKGVMLPNLMGSPEWQTTLRAYGGNVAAAQAAMQAEAVKKGTLELRSGGEARIPDMSAPGGYRTIRTPNLSPDMDYTRGANGDITEAHNIPGAVPALEAQKGGVTAAEEQNKPRMIPMGGGVERLGYPQDVGAGLPPALRGTMPPAVGASPGLTAPGPGQQASPQPAPSMPQAPAPRSYFPQPQAAAPPQAQGLQLPQKDDSGVIHNNLWPNIPKMQVPQTPGQTSNAYQQEIVKSAAAKHQELVNEYGKQSAAGVQQLEYLTEAEKALPKAETGPMSEWLTHNRGILVQQFPSLAGALGGDKVTPTLELNKQLTNAALQGARSTFGTRMTQNEVKLQTEEMSPSTAMTHDALVSLIHQAKMKAAYAIQQDKDYGEYHAQNGDPNRFESQYNVRRPITRFAAQYDTQPAALDRLRKNPHMLPDFKTKFGWDPTQ